MVENNDDEQNDLDPLDSSADPSDSIAIELRLAREAKGLGLSDLHRLTGLSRTTLNQYESGLRKPGARELIKLCEALEVTPNRLLFGRESPFEQSSQGVLTALALMAKANPGRAAGIGAVLMPLAATILSKVGGESLYAIATLADEILRDRDPKAYHALATTIKVLKDIPAEEIVNSPPEQKEALLTDIAKRIQAKMDEGK